MSDGIFSVVSSGVSLDESSKLINEVFRLICDLVNDEAKIVRVQAMKMIVSIDQCDSFESLLDF